MGIQSNKKRKSMLGSVEVTSLEADVQNVQKITEVKQNIRKEVSGTESRAGVKYSQTTTPQQKPAMEASEAGSYKLGRKRKEIIPGEKERNFTIQLPESLINKMKAYGLEHNMSLKDVVAELLINKFMK